MSDKAPPEWRLTMREQSIYEAGYGRGGRDAAALGEIFEERLDSWRAWAQFVYLRGGAAVGTDEELQRSVCAAHDAALAAAAAPPAATGAWVRDFSGWATLIVAHVRNIDAHGQSEGLSPEFIVARVLADMFPAPPYGLNRCSFDGNLRPCPHHDLPPTGVPASSPLATGAGQTGETIATSGWGDTREKSE